MQQNGWEHTNAGVLRLATIINVQGVVEEAAGTHREAGVVPRGLRAPEGFTLLGSRSDAWLLGCLLWELSTRIKLSLQEDVVLPRLTPTQEESIFVRYCIEQGSAYEQGDTLLEIETEEKIVQMKAERDGVCATYLLEEGTTIYRRRPICAK